MKSEKKPDFAHLFPLSAFFGMIVLSSLPMETKIIIKKVMFDVSPTTNIPNLITRFHLVKTWLTSENLIKKKITWSVKMELKASKG